MALYIDKSALVAEIERRIVEYKDMKIDSSYYEGMIASLEFFRDEFINTLEAEDMSMPALDNGNMPVERWKEACEAASCQANYRKSKGLTETCDDYFVDGVQWADEHPKKVKEIDLKKSLTDFMVIYAYENCGEYPSAIDIAKHFFELALSLKNS